VIARKLKAEQSQSTIDGHLVEKKLTNRPVAYSDKLFRQVTIEWLVATDQVRLVLHFGLPANTFLQPIQAFGHPKYKEMIDVASRATNGVKIPSRKATRNEIVALFKKHLTNLKSRWNVCTRFIEPIRCLNLCRLRP
jgi:hypothetical protein